MANLSPSSARSIPNAQPATSSTKPATRRPSADADHAPTKALIFDSLLYRHWNTYQGAKRSHILMLHVARAGYIYDLTPAADWGKNIIAPPFALGGSLGYAWSPDSKEFAFVLNADKVPAASTNNDIYTIDITQHDGSDTSATGWSPKKISTSPGSDDAPAYSPDGKYLAFRSQARGGYESDRFRLMLYDRQTKTIREVLPEFGGWIDEFVWSPKATGFYFVSGIEGEASVFYSDISGESLYSIKQGGEFNSLTVEPLHGSNGFRIVAAKMKANGPAEIVSLFPSDAGMKALNSEGKLITDRFGAERHSSTEGCPEPHQRSCSLSN